VADVHHRLQRVGAGLEVRAFPVGQRHWHPTIVAGGPVNTDEEVMKGLGA
jgi:hypothetical protein